VVAFVACWPKYAVGLSGFGTRTAVRSEMGDRNLIVPPTESGSLSRCLGTELLISWTPGVRVGVSCVLTSLQKPKSSPPTESYVTEFGLSFVTPSIRVIDLKVTLELPRVQG
jgi:hypothetical protein